MQFALIISSSPYVINYRKKETIILHTEYETNCLSSHGNRFYRIGTFVMSINAIRM